MFKIKDVSGKNVYSRYGKVIPKKETIFTSCQLFLSKPEIAESILLASLMTDRNIVIEELQSESVKEEDKSQPIKKQPVKKLDKEVEIVDEKDRIHV